MRTFRTSHYDWLNLYGLQEHKMTQNMVGKPLSIYVYIL